MQFSTIFKHMKEDGIKAKLPSWGGYWEWDSEKETIMMHCNGVDSDTGKEVLDIRETQRLDYTMQNVLSDKWIEATPENTPILGGVAKMDFNEAYGYLKRGFKMTRIAWNNTKCVWLDNDENTGKPRIVTNVDGGKHSTGVLSGFRPEDIEATDWVFYNEEEK